MKKLSFLLTVVAALSLFGFGVQGVQAEWPTYNPGFFSASASVSGNTVTISVGGSLEHETTWCGTPDLGGSYPYVSFNPSSATLKMNGSAPFNGLYNLTLSSGAIGFCPGTEETGAGAVRSTNGNSFTLNNVPAGTYTVPLVRTSYNEGAQIPANVYGTSNRSVTFTVSGTTPPPTPAPTVTLTANPTSVVSGNTTTLTWSSTNATSCTATAGAGFSTGGATSSSDASSALSANTTFSVSCTGAGGTANANANVTVTQPPTGNYCSSIIVTSNAPTNWLIGGPQTNGQNIPSPGYPAYVTSGTATTDSSGNPLPIGSYGGPLGSGFHADLTPDGWYGPTLSPNSAQQCNTGGSISWTLTYKKDGACGSANGQTFSTAPTTNLCSAGTASSVTSNPTTWTWTCAGISGGTTASCSANKPAGEQVTVDMAVRLAGINPYGDSVTLPAGGGSVDIRWLTTGSPTSCTASASPVLAAWSGNKGVLETNVQTGIANGTSMRTYSISCTNGSSTATDSVVVYVGAPVLPTVTLSANPNPVSYGQPTTLTWSSTNATSCSVTQGAGFDTGGAISGSDQSSNIYASPETFGVTCTGPGGSASATTVVKLKPECLPAGQTVGVGQQASLTARGGNPYTQQVPPPYAWTSAGGTPTSGSGSAYSVSYATEGVKSVTVASDGMTSAACTVTVTTTPPTTGTVIVRSLDGDGNPLPSTWTVAGPATRVEGNPVTEKTYTDMPVGSYVISAENLSGYTLTVIPSTSQYLNAGLTITFTLRYDISTEPPPGGGGPYVDLRVNGDKVVDVAMGGEVYLTWTSDDIVSGSCVAQSSPTGWWSGSKADTQGLERGDLGELIQNITERIEFTLTCESVVDGSDVFSSATVRILEQQPPPPPEPPQVTECNDGLDNDGDGKIDHSSVTPLGKTSDPGCKSPDDPSELDDPNIREI